MRFIQYRDDILNQAKSNNITSQSTDWSEYYSIYNSSRTTAHLQMTEICSPWRVDSMSLIPHWSLSIHYFGLCLQLMFQKQTNKNRFSISFWLQCRMPHITPRSKMLTIAPFTLKVAWCEYTTSLIYILGFCRGRSESIHLWRHIQ